MKNILFISFLILTAAASQAQKIDSIYFHLYTDSLKKGTHNYINVDGKLKDGTWMPLTSKHIDFITSYGSFEGNDLILPDTSTQQKITIKAVLKTNPSIWREITVWIKKKPDDEELKTTREILDEMNRGRKGKKKG